MRFTSPTQKFTSRLELRQRSKKAMASTYWTVADSTGSRRFASRARRMTACALSFYYRVVTPDNDATRVEISNTRPCRIRTCPACAAYGAKLMREKMNLLFNEVLTEHPDARILLLTLTLPSQPIATCSLDSLQAALKRFWKMPEVRGVTLGQRTSIEAKMSGTKEHPTMHGHAHCGVVVKGPVYFITGLPAVHQTTWASWWQKAAKMDRKPVVDIRAVKSWDGATDPAAMARAWREITKYAFSPEGVFQHGEDGITVDPAVVLALDNALRNKRLCTYDRCFKDAAKRLKKSRS